MTGKIINQLHQALTKQKKTIAIAESCTGGTLSSCLTSLPGSSAYFTFGIVAYSNRAKTKLLRVPAGLISSKGAVSREVAICLAVNARKISRADIALGITGIAGPAGGTPQKPVGTVYIAVSANNKTSCVKYLLKGSRDKIRKETALRSLLLLKRLLRTSSSKLQAE